MNIFPEKVCTKFLKRQIKILATSTIKNRRDCLLAYRNWLSFCNRAQVERFFSIPNTWDYRYSIQDGFNVIKTVRMVDSVN